MIFPLLIAFSLPWLIVLIGYAVVMAWLLSDADEHAYQVRPLYATTGVVLVLFILFGSIPPKQEFFASVLSWLSSAAWKIGLYLLVCGPIWAALRWRLVFLERCHAKYEVVRDEWLVRRKLPTGVVPAAMQSEFRKYLFDYQIGSYPHYVFPYQRNGSQSSVDGVQIWPSWRDHKARVFSWWLWWPLSLASYFLWDFVRNVFTHIFQAMARAMDNLSRCRFADVEGDVSAPINTVPAKIDQ